jgi:hypothetical protein
MSNKRTVLVSLVFALVASLLFLGLTLRETKAASCPSGDTFVNSVTAPNGNSLLVCQSSYAGGSLGWYIYDSSDHLLNSSGQGGATFQDLYATPDSKFLFVCSLSGALGWYIYGSNGQQCGSSGQSGATLQGVAITNDGKIAFVYYTNSALGWYIYGSNCVQTAGSGGTGWALRNVWATGDNKLHVEICSSNTVSTYNYGVAGTLESTTSGGSCSPASVGGIAEAPDVVGAEAVASESTGTNYALWAGIAAAGAVGATTLGAGLWFARRRRLS